MDGTLSEARYQFAGGIIDGSLYVFGGKGGPERSNRTTTIRYNFTNHMASFVAPQNFYWVEELSTAVYDGKMYVFGGRGRTEDDREAKKRNFCLEYDPITDSWKDLEPRIDLKSDAAPCVVYDGEIYLFGGFDNDDNWVYAVHAYDPNTDDWREETTIPKPISNFTVAVVDTKVFLIGGVDRSASGQSEILWSMEVLSYDFGAKTWQESGYANLPQPGRAFSYCHEAPVINGRIYCIGGNTDRNEVTNLVDIYNPRINMWTRGDALPAGTGSACIAQHGSTIYVAGGIIGFDEGLADESIRTDNVYRLDVAQPEVIQIPFEFNKGWNLFSFPIIPPNFDIETFFQGKSMGSLWDFEDSRYRQAESVEAGHAYWTFLKEKLSFVLSYVPSESSTPDQRQLESGWNLYGVRAPISIPTENSNIVWYYLDGQFRTVPRNSDLQPGIGYWIDLRAETELSLGSLATDTDEDDLPDFWEALWKFDCRSATDRDFDSDLDQLSNYEEYLAGTNPRERDTDQDGISDGFEREKGCNPLEPDLTTVIGRTMNKMGDPIPGTQVEVLDTTLSGTTDNDGRFTIPNAPGCGDLKVRACGLIQGREACKISAPTSPVPGSISNIGEIFLAATLYPGMKFAVGNAPRSVVVANVNGDAHFDIITANEDSDDISVLFGNGDGTFQAQQLLSASDRTQSAAVANVNGDAHLDIIAANEGSDDVSVLLGNGDGTFQNQKRFPAGDGPVFVTVAKVNDDAHLDIVTANESSDDVSVLLGNDDGTFQAPKPFSTGGNPLSVAIAKVNDEDDHFDLVTANADSSDVSVLLGNGDGSFQPERRFDIGVDVGDRPQSVTVANVNADDYLDIITANGFSPDVSVLLGNGDGTFQTQQRFPAGDEPESVAVANVNDEDDHLDLVTANESSDDVSVLLGNGDGTFQNEKRFLAGDAPASVAVANVNDEDDHLDLVTANEFSDDVSVLLGKGDGTFQPEQRFPTGDGLVFIAIANVNTADDDHLDLITANVNSSDVSVLLGKGDGAFQNEKRFPAGDGPASVAIKDVNADGSLDLVTANENSDDVSVLLHQ